jgi:hypothetical protein
LPDSAIANVESRKSTAAQQAREKGFAESEAGFSTSLRPGLAKAYFLPRKRCVKGARTATPDLVRNAFGCLRPYIAGGEIEQA